jgi:phenylpropionate dioxygenase-like ring-hydroxylating dioxygenase large terminal subunit
VNGCRHRGSPLVDERGCAEGGRLQCPFHAWTYSTDGSLETIPLAEEAFSAFDRAEMGLHGRPCLESEGMIFVRAEGAEAIDPDEALQGIGNDLRSLDLSRYHPFETRTTHWQCNWKLVLDTFLESYHVFSLHRETVHPWYFSMPMVYDGWGPNLRFPVARRTIEELAEKPEESWRLADHATVQWLVGSNALISHTRDYLLLWRFSSPEPGSCEARTTLYAASPIESAADEKRLGNAFDLQMRVTGAEDFPMQERIQSVLASGAIPELVYGRNEVATIHFHRALQAIMDAGASI